MNSTTNHQVLRKLRAIESAESYLIARTRHEIRATQASAGHLNAGSRKMLAASAACMAAAFVLVQVWPLFVPAASV
jgi:hypothetical protein